MGQEYAPRVIDRLRERGFKITPQRVAILEHLAGNTEHPSAEDIYREVSRAFPSISLATVYNTLDTLEALQEIRTVTVDPTRKHYDPDTSDHHHALCTRCHTILDVFADLAAEVTVPPAVAERFRVEETTVHLRGVCRDCAGA